MQGAAKGGDGCDDTGGGQIGAGIATSHDFLGPQEQAGGPIGSVDGVDVSADGTHPIKRASKLLSNPRQVEARTMAALSTRLRPPG